MKILAISEERGRLGHWLTKTTQREVVCDYALQEYGLAIKELAAAEKRISAELKTARKRGELTRFIRGKAKFR